MARIQTFAQDLQLATAGISPQNIAAALAQFAKAELANVIASGEGSPNYDRYVNGALGADESTVVAPGPILYVFRWWDEIVEFALQTLIDLSPVQSGDYKKSWQVLVNGSVVSDFKNIPINATVMITNTQPYHRKIDVGHMKMSVPPFIVEAGVGKVKGIFGNIVDVKRVMTTLPGGYILKGYFTRGVRKNARTKLRKDTAAGAQMTYPAMLLSMKVG